MSAEAPTTTGTKLTRGVLATAGIALALYGVFRLVTQLDLSNLLALAGWLIAAVIIHDGIIAPLTGLAGLVIRFVPQRARAYLQGSLVAALLVTVVALPFIHREGVGAPAKALLQQNFRANLAILVGIVAGAGLVLYAVRVLRERTRSSSTNDRPPHDHDSTSA